MRIIILFISLSLTLNICGQTVEDTKHNFQKTRVLGTRIYIETPEGFKSSMDFVGFESGESLIQFIDLFGGNYHSNARNFTKENFESRGVKVLNFEELKIDNYPAKMAFLQGNAYQKSLQLVFGDDEFSVLAIAIVTNNEQDRIEKIRKAFLTIEYDKQSIIDPFENAFFELDDSKSIYKYAKATSNFYMYSKNGVKKESYNGESFYMVSQIPNEFPDINPKSLLEDNLNSLKKKGLIISKRVVSDRKKLNGFKCYEELIIGTLNDEETQIKMTSVIKGTHGILINGLAKNNFEFTLQEFEKLTNELIMK